MASCYASHVSTKQTPQTSPIPGTTQVENSAGGFTWEVSDWTRLDRFICLGAEGNTFYTTERELTIENAACVERCAKLDGVRTVNRIVEISVAGRAPKNDPALVAMAIVAKVGSGETKQAADAVGGWRVGGR